MAVVQGRVSVVVPSRNERFLVPTVRDLLAKSAGDLEVIVVLEGYWEHGLAADPRLKILHHGSPQGMRPSINAAVQMATGEYILKADAHTMWADGFDVTLKADYHEDNWILIPRRYPLDPEKWAFEERRDDKYPVDAHFISEPFGKYGDSVPGIHASPWKARREATKHMPIAPEIGSQGSAYFLSRKCWDWIGGLNHSLYGSFWYENLELSMTCWTRGGAQMRTLNTHYSHLFKGRRHGRGYSTRGMGHEAATQYASWFWMTDQPFPGKVRTFRSVVEQFLPMPTWDDPAALFARAHRELRNPYQVAA